MDRQPARGNTLRRTLALPEAHPPLNEEEESLMARFQTPSVIFSPIANQIADQARDHTNSANRLPEHDLLWAIIEVALYDYTRWESNTDTSSNAYRHAKKSRMWIYSNNHAPGSFIWCCQIFQDPDYAIKTIRKFTRVHPSSRMSRRHRLT